MKCFNCNKKTKPYKTRKGYRKYCSRKCFNLGHSDLMKIKKPSWKGGVTYRNGYKFIYKPNHPYTNGSGYVREHRLLMEKYLGRYLYPEPLEIVHHKNGVRDDNRVSNLELLTKGQHSSIHIKELNRIRWQKK